MSSHTQKGTGLYQQMKKVLNKLSGRKAVTQRLLKPRKLTAEEARRKNILQNKEHLTKKEKKEYELLTAKLAPRQNIYEIQKRNLLRERSPKQKFFNRFYRNEPNESGEAEGFLLINKNYRKPLLKENLQVANNDIPVPENIRPVTRRIVNGVEMNLRSETQRLSQQRAFSWMYQKAFDRPTSTPHHITETEFKELQEVIQGVVGKEYPTGDLRLQILERLARDIFKASSLAEFDKELQLEETGAQREKKIVETNGQYYISESYGAYLDRYLNLFYADFKRLNYITEYEEYQCWPDPSNLPNFDESGHIRKQPLTTLKSNQCISLVNDPKKIYEMSDSDGLQSNWLALEPLYYPQLHLSNSRTKKDLQAKYFQQASFVKDALDNWGVTAMDPLLWKLFETKYPEISIKLSTYIFTNFRDKVPLYLQQLKITENFIVVDASIKFEKGVSDFMGLSLRNPFSSQSKLYPKMKEALNEKKIYGMTTYMAYFMKKTIPNDWIRLFDPSKKNYNVYKTLNAHEKMAIDYLQYLRFMETLLDNNYDFILASETYSDFLGDGSATEGLIKEIVDLYKEDVAKHSNEISFFQSLVTHQLQEDENHAVLTRPQDIQLLLLKFRGPAIDVSRRREPVSALAEAALSLRIPAPRNELTQLRSRIQQLKEERNVLLRNPIVFNAASTTRKNRAAVNKMYANQLRRLGFFSRFTKAQQRKQLQLNQAAARKAFQELNALNRNIQQLEQELARRYPRLPQSPVPSGNAVTPPPANTPPANGAPPLPASPGSSAGTARSSASTASLPAYPPAAGVLGNL